MTQSDFAIAEANLQAVVNSDIPGDFLRIHPDGWSDTDWEILMSRVERAGFWPIDEKKFGRIIEVMAERKHRAVRRARPRETTSIERIQTPTNQADASWVDGEDFARRYAHQEGHLFFGRSPESGVALGHDDEQHVFMACGSRGGKGTGTIIPNHLLWPGSLVSVDPKGENATASAPRRGDGRPGWCDGMGQKVCVLDPFGCSHVEDKYRYCFNPLEELDPADPQCVAKAATIADSLVLMTGRETEDYWKKDAIKTIKGLILHLVTSPQFKGRRNLVMLRKLISSGDVEAAGAFNAGKPVKDHIDPHDMLYGMMEGNLAWDGIIAAAGSRLAQIRIEQVKQWQGFQSTMDVHTDWIDDPRMRDNLQSSDLSLSELKSLPQGLSIYLCMPEIDMRNYSRWHRVVLNLAAYALTRNQTMPACGHRVLMVLDEFAAFERMEQFERGIAYFAGHKVKLVVVVQSFARIKHIYQECWEEFLGNSSLKIFFALNGITTPQAVSEWLGDIELIRHAESTTVSMGASRQVGASAGHNRQETEGLQETDTFGVGASFSDSEQQSKSRQRSQGGFRSHQDGFGSSESSSYDQYRWLFRDIQKNFRRLRPNEKTQLGMSYSSSDSGGKNWNEGVTDQAGTSHSNTLSLQQGRSRGRNRGIADGVSSNITGSTGENVSYSGGLQEVFHTRRLITPYEIGKWFATNTDKNDPFYPGLALVVVSGEDPAIIQKVNYYTDPLCDGYWVENPDYPDSRPRPLVRPTELKLLDERRHLWLENEAPVISRWHKQPGDIIRQGEHLLDVKPGPSFTPYSDAEIPIHAPISGEIISIDYQAGATFDFGNVLGIIRYNLPELRKEWHGHVDQQVFSYNAGDHPAYQEYLRNKSAHQERIQAQKTREEDERRLAIEREQERIEDEVRRRQEQIAAEERRKQSAYDVAEYQFKMAYQGVSLLVGVLGMIGCQTYYWMNLRGWLGGFFGLLIGIVASLFLSFLLLSLSEAIRKIVLEFAWKDERRKYL